MPTTDQPLYSQKGFTLIELLLVIGILGILMSLVMAYVRPSEIMGGADNAKRHANLKAILHAVQEYYIDTNGGWPRQDETNAITDSELEICVAPDSMAGVYCNLYMPKKVYLGDLVPKPLSTIPRDPKHDAEGNPYGTSYFIYKDADDRIHVSAPLGKDGVGITKSR